MKRKFASLLLLSALALGALTACGGGGTGGASPAGGGTGGASPAASSSP
jgi:hypothetical protein